MQGLARLTDGHLRSLWAQAGLPEHLALVAVGGYGRGELYPASDVDVLILLPEGCDASLPPLQGALEAFIGACWATGLEIGPSVRTLGQGLAQCRVCCQTQIIVAAKHEQFTRLTICTTYPLHRCSR